MLYLMRKVLKLRFLIGNQRIDNLFKPLRSWRIVGESREAAYCFFDPSREIILIRNLTMAERVSKIEKDVSVSALVEVEESCQKEIPYAEIP